MAGTLRIEIKDNKSRRLDSIEKSIRQTNGIIQKDSIAQQGWQNDRMNIYKEFLKTFHDICDILKNIEMKKIDIPIMKDDFEVSIRWKDIDKIIGQRQEDLHVINTYTMETNKSYAGIESQQGGIENSARKPSPEFIWETAKLDSKKANLDEGISEIFEMAGKVKKEIFDPSDSLKKVLEESSSLFDTKFFEKMGYIGEAATGVFSATEEITIGAMALLEGNIEKGIISGATGLTEGLTMALGAFVGTFIGVGPIVGMGVASTLAPLLGKGVGSLFETILTSDNKREAKREASMLNVGAEFKQLADSYQAVVDKRDYTQELMEEYSRLNEGMKTGNLTANDKMYSQLEMDNIAAELERYFPHIITPDKLKNDLTESDIHRMLLENNMQVANGLTDFKFKVEISETEEDLLQLIEKKRALQESKKLDEQIKVIGYNQTYTADVRALYEKFTVEYDELKSERDSTTYNSPEYIELNTELTKLGNSYLESVNKVGKDLLSTIEENGDSGLGLNYKTDWDETGRIHGDSNLSLVQIEEKTSALLDTYTQDSQEVYQAIQSLQELYEAKKIVLEGENGVNIDKIMTQLELLNAAGLEMYENGSLSEKLINQLQSYLPELEIDLSTPEAFTETVASIEEAFNSIKGENEVVLQQMQELNATVGENVIKEVIINTTYNATIKEGIALGRKAQGYGGFLPEYANGGILSRPHMGLVAEDGPESIIPLSSKRRDRGISLWEQTGKILGVFKHATGGIFGGTQISPLSINEEDGFTESNIFGVLQSTEKDLGVNVNVNVSPTFNIGEREDGDNKIVVAIKNNIREMADEIGDEIANRLQKVFSNMPIT